ncbi:MAG TPA: ATP-binding cassette domain-containing protein, partial [Planctomycetes bacterium]|nr:ATP-binding cassette domain-containing protein [Planctomycetota bacterium]
MRVKLLEMMAGCEGEITRAATGPTVILVVGVNGAGKTTSIAKLANYLKKEGNIVLLGAGDTFRAAAVEQLTLWSERLGIEIVKQETGADPAAVAFDATAAAIARKVEAREMPPWYAAGPKDVFSNERGLTDEEIGKLVQWVEAGAPAGETTDAPEPHQFVENTSGGWSLGTPDFVFQLDEPYFVD